jgi:hypothetical protein
MGVRFGHFDWNATLPPPGEEWRGRDEFNTLSDRSVSEHLRLLHHDMVPLQDDDVVLIGVVRNEALRLPAFIEHYKRLGVSRFFMVDNASEDGTLDLLLSEPTATVFHTSASYRDSCCGIYWINGIARAYCIGHWTVLADADELLTYHGHDKNSLSDLGKWLTNNSLDRLFALMVDVYPRGIIGESGYSIAESLRDDSWFDTTGYALHRHQGGWLALGGPRQRLFGKRALANGEWTSKHPFFLMKPETVIFSAHFVWPRDEKPARPLGALIHLKFMDDFAERAARNEREGQHYENAKKYRIINETLADQPKQIALYEKSHQYSGPDSLIRHGLMLPIDWNEAAGDALPYLRTIGDIDYRYWSGFARSLSLSLDEREEFEDFSRRSFDAHLTSIRCRGHLSVGEIGLVCVLRNEIGRLPLFFEHYRALGVTRFLMIDNGSDDGSHEFLLAQSDADVFLTNTPFRQGQAGLYWANAVARKFCVGNWILRADADELLVYDGMDEHGLVDLAHWLDAGGLDRLFAPLLDIYPSGVIGAEQRDSSELLRRDCWFDPEGYELRRIKAGWHLSGGARRRLFGQERKDSWPVLSKYPFFRMTDEVIIFNHHWQWPCDEVTEGPQGALLHLKLVDDLAERAERYAREGQHFNGSEDYRLIAGQLAARRELVAFHENSSRYRGPRSLVRHSFILPISWDEPTSPDEIERRRRLLRPPPQQLSRTRWVRTLPDEGETWENRQSFNWQSRSTLSEHMTVVRCRGPLKPGEIGVICVARNEADRLPCFFEHYRMLGVTRFFMVDNNSDDGTAELLAAEPLADIFFAHASYADGLGGIYWANALAREFGSGCWMVRADADELLVYDGVGERSLAQLGEWLQKNDCDRLFALMIDIYPSGDIDDHDRSISEILKTDCWFDSEGYTESRVKGGWLITGGPRHRLFNNGMDIHTHWLSKYPFFHMTEEMSIVDAHFLWPIDPAKPVVQGAVLHLKLMDDFRARSRRYEEEGQHALGSRAYQIINRELAAMPKLVAHYPDSRRYDGPASLIRHGMMQPIDWDA